MYRNPKVLEAIKLLPEEYTIVELLDKMRLLKKIEKDIAQSEEGEVISDKELDIEISQWFN